MRHKHPALRRGTFHRLYAKDNVFAFARSVEEETIIIIINGGTDTVNTDIPAPSVLQNRTLIPILGDVKTKVQNGKILDLKLAPRSGIVLGAIPR